MTLQAVKNELKRGVQPHQMKGFTAIGEGVKRVAYTDGKFVVKRLARIPFKPKNISKAVRFAESIIVHRTRECAYEIQRRVDVVYVHDDNDTYKATGERFKSPITDDAAERMIEKACKLVGYDRWNYDLHYGNYGIDKRRRVVFFDW